MDTEKQQEIRAICFDSSFLLNCCLWDYLSSTDIAKNNVWNPLLFYLKYIAKSRLVFYSRTYQLKCTRSPIKMSYSQDTCLFKQSVVKYGMFKCLNTSVCSYYPQSTLLDLNKEGIKLVASRKLHNNLYVMATCRNDAKQPPTETSVYLCVCTLCM